MTPHLLQIFRERLKPGAEVEYAAIEDEICRLCAQLGCPLLAVFGGLALGLASIGVYGVMAYSVSQRTREIGVRLALGATAGEVRRLVFKQGLFLALAGIIVGIVVAALVAGYVEQLLFDVRGIDPVTFIAIPAILIVVAALAIYIPARRASRVDPIVALRSN